MLKDKLYIIFFLIIFSNSIKDNSATNNSILYESLSLIIKETFIERDTRLLFHVNFNNSSKEELFNANDFLSAILYDLNNATYTIYYQRKKIFSNQQHNEIVFLDNLDSLRYFYEDLYNIGTMNLARTLMVISSITTIDFKEISSIFEYLYHMGIIRLAFLVQLAPDDIVMLTYFPFSPKSCHDVSPVIINRYLVDQHRWEKLKYFPSKLLDFYGCPLTCCAWANMPYFSVKYHPTNGQIIDYMGIEGELLKFAAANLNFSINVNIMSNATPKSLYNEGSIFAKVFSETCDFALGGFAYKMGLNQTSPFSQTDNYFLSDVHLITNIFTVYTTYEKIAFPFQYIVWYMIGVIFLACSSLIYISERRRHWKRYLHFVIGANNTTPIYYLFTLAVGDNMTEVRVPKRNFARFLFICWLLATLVLRCAYQSGMYQMLRDNKQRNLPNTIENAFKQNYVISMTPENRRYLPILPEVKRLQIFNTTIMPGFAELLKANEPTAFIAPKEYYRYFGKLNLTYWQRLHLINERLITNQLTCYVRHHSYLINVLNDQITDSHYYGFSTLWSRKYLQMSKGSPHGTGGSGGGSAGNEDPENDEDQITYALSMQELGAIFMIILWLYIFSTVVFLIELIWYKYKKVVENKERLN